MIALGIILIIVGWLLASLHVLLIIGVILLIAGLVVNFVPFGRGDGRIRHRVW